jgi:hypothetical protein
MTYGTECSTPFDGGDLEHVKRHDTAYIDASGEVLIPHAFSPILLKVRIPSLSCYSDVQLFVGHTSCGNKGIQMQLLSMLRVTLFTFAPSRDNILLSG